jgi:dynein heavy chain 1
VGEGWDLAYSAADISPPIRSIADFEKIYNSCDKIFKTWTEQADSLRQMLRELSQAARTAKAKAVKKMDPKHKPLQDKLVLLRKFRLEHNQLASVIAKVLRRVDEDSERAEGANLMNPDDLDAIEEVKLAYDEMKNVDILDLSEQGIQAWEIAKKK